jgi:hypothetical protein
MLRGAKIGKAGGWEEMAKRVRDEWIIMISSKTPDTI